MLSPFSIDEIRRATVALIADGQERIVVGQIIQAACQQRAKDPSRYNPNGTGKKSSVPTGQIMAALGWSN